MVLATDAAAGRQRRDVKRQAVSAVLRKLFTVMSPRFWPVSYTHLQLSGGQQQRVAIARAMATDPEIIYFDEPTSALDPELTGEVLGVMRDLAQSGMTMLVVTHELGFARNAANKVVFMEKGVVVEEAPAKEFFTQPKTERAKEFLRLLNQE